MTEAKPDIMAVMEREGIELKRRGRDFWAPCPFHDDKTPSFKVNIEHQRWHCWGCGEHGDVISFIQKHHNVNFKDALVYLGIKPGKKPLPNPAIERKKKIQREYNEKITAIYDSLCQQARELHKFRLQVAKNPALTDAGAILFAQRMGLLAEIDYKIDTLLNGDFREQISLLKETVKNDSANTQCRAA